MLTRFIWAGRWFGHHRKWGWNIGVITKKYPHCKKKIIIIINTSIVLSGFNAFLIYYYWVPQGSVFGPLLRKHTSILLHTYRQAGWQYSQGLAPGWDGWMSNPNSATLQSLTEPRWHWPQEAPSRRLHCRNWGWSTRAQLESHCSGIISVAFVTPGVSPLVTGSLHCCPWPLK